VIEVIVQKENRFVSVDEISRESPSFGDKEICSILTERRRLCQMKFPEVFPKFASSMIVLQYLRCPNHQHFNDTISLYEPPPHEWTRKITARIVQSAPPLPSLPSL
jgi:hypothetical protein